MKQIEINRILTAPPRRSSLSPKIVAMVLPSDRHSGRLSIDAACRRRPAVSDQIAMPRFLALAAVILAILVPALARAEAGDEIFANRPAFSRGEVPPRAIARCDNLRAMAEGLTVPDFRIDLAASGTLTLVKTDGALWYLVICSDLRVMCVTYEGNDMAVGALVTVKGAWRRLDRNHAVLDPCLASRGDDADAETSKDAR